MMAKVSTECALCRPLKATIGIHWMAIMVVAVGKGFLQCCPRALAITARCNVAGQYHFAYADGAPYYSIGTTCYVWNLQPDERISSPSVIHFSISPATCQGNRFAVAAFAVIRRRDLWLQESFTRRSSSAYRKY